MLTGNLVCLCDIQNDVRPLGFEVGGKTFWLRRPDGRTQDLKLRTLSGKFTSFPWRSIATFKQKSPRHFYKLYSIHQFFSENLGSSHKLQNVEKKNETVRLVETDLHLMCLPAPRPSEMFINVGKVDGRDICYTGWGGGKSRVTRNDMQLKCANIWKIKGHQFWNTKSQRLVKVEISSMSICTGLATGFTPMWILGDVFLRQAEFHDTWFDLKS